MVGGLRVAIYDTPNVVGKKLSDALRNAGHDVLYSGPLNNQTARSDADVWLTKWSFRLTGPNNILLTTRPRIGILTLSVGTDHIDESIIDEFHLKLSTCPTSYSNSVAEHAFALAFRILYGKSTIGPFSDKQTFSGEQIIFPNFSDKFAEAAVAHMLMQCRQLEASIGRANAYNYARGDAPWGNQELASTTVGIFGHTRNAAKLAKILKFGFGARLIGLEVGENLAAFGIEEVPLDKLLSDSQYLFLCDDLFMISGARVPLTDSYVFDQDALISGSKVAVLGTGRIGSIIARIAKLGFGCDVVAYNRSEDNGLRELGVRYADVPEAVQNAKIILVALPSTKLTEGLVSGKLLKAIPMAKSAPIIVNVARDVVIETEGVYRLISNGAVAGYGTDVLPRDKSLWAGGEPDDLTRNFVLHDSVVATPHEADASRQSLERLCVESIRKLSEFGGSYV